MKKSVKKRIEEDSHPNLEKGMVRVKGEKWRDFGEERRKYTLGISPEYVDRETRGHNYTFLHTHPTLGKDTVVENPKTVLGEINLETFKTNEERKKVIESLRKDDSLFSNEDIMRFLTEKNYRTAIVAQRDPVNGKVQGFYFLRKTKKTPELPQYPRDDKEMFKWKWLPQIKNMRHAFPWGGSAFFAGGDSRERVVRDIANLYHLQFSTLLP